MDPLAPTLGELSRRAAHSVVLEAVSLAVDRAESRALRDAAFPHAARLAVEDMLRVLPVAFPTRDCGEFHVTGNDCQLPGRAAMDGHDSYTRGGLVGGAVGAGDVDHQPTVVSSGAANGSDNGHDENVMSGVCVGGGRRAYPAHHPAGYEMALEADLWSRFHAAWVPDEEPLPEPIDAHARGAVPVRTRVVISNSANAGEANDAENAGANARAGSRRQSPSVVSRSTRRSGNTNKDGTRDKGSKSGNKGDKASDASVQRKAMMNAKALDTDKARRVALAGGDQRMQVKFETIRARQQRERQQIKRLEAEQAELRGREYTFDSEGNPIVVKRVEPARLPQQRVAPKTSVRPTAAEEQERELVKKYGRANAKKRATVRRDDLDVLADDVLEEHAREEREILGAAGKRKALKQGKPAPGFEPHKSWQPPAVDTMPLNVGVSVREGGKAKSGPRPQPIPDRMSREEYVSLTNSMAASNPALGVSTAAGDDATVDNGTSKAGTMDTSQAFSKQQQKQTGAGGGGRGMAGSTKRTKSGTGTATSTLTSSGGGGSLIPPGVHKIKARQPGLDLASRSSPYVHSSIPRRLPAGQPHQGNPDTGEGSGYGSTNTKNSITGTKKKGYSFSADTSAEVVVANPERVRQLLG